MSAGGTYISGRSSQARATKRPIFFNHEFSPISKNSASKRSTRTIANRLSINGVRTSQNQQRGIIRDLLHRFSNCNDAGMDFQKPHATRHREKYMKMLKKHFDRQKIVKTLI